MTTIWTRPERAARGPAPEHSRGQIAAAAVALADASGLASVTMRSTAAAIGTAAASLYRYVAGREELVQLMADLVYGEFSFAGLPAGSAPPEGGPRDPVPELLEIARQGLALYRRHPWLLDVAATGNLPGPNALAFIEQTLAALAGSGLDGPARLETVGLFSGVVRLYAQTEIGQQRAGRDAAGWQESLARYLVEVAAAGRHPQLAAALADQGVAAASDAAASDAGTGEAAFDRAMTRILNGLVRPGHP
jgi:AcrR family transcriptional regulator